MFYVPTLSKINPELLMVAGSHHKKTGHRANMNSHYKELLRFLNKQFNVDKVISVVSTAYSMPYIELACKSTKHIYMATGYFADGLVYGTLAGII